MRIAAESALLALLVATPQASAAKVFSFDISRSSAPISELRRRDAGSKTFAEVIQNAGAGNGYTANITVGTPPQTITLGIDTGSTNIWVLSNTANFCLNKTLEALGRTCAGGTFNANKSSTVETVVPGGFSATYVDKSGASGDFITDNLSIGGKTIKAMQMGLAFNSTSPQGILGLGYDTLENVRNEYPSFIDQLVAQSFINTKAFSLYLNDLAASTGSILFGGIDTEKFTGTLTSLALIPDFSTATPASPDGIIDYYGVALSSVSITIQPGNTTNFPLSSTASDGSTVPAIGVVLDSGSVFTYLPTATVQSIYTLLNAIASPLSPFFIYVDCALLTTYPSLTISFTFTNSSGPTIAVPINEFIFPLADYGPIAGHISALGTLPFKETCMFGLLGAENAGGATILGDTFLRSAYVVFDLENDVVGIAQTNFNSTTSNVVELAAGASGLPVVSGVSSSSSSSVTATPTGTSGATSTGTVGAKTTPSGTGSAAATSATSKAAAVGSNPMPFDMRGLLVLSVAGLGALMGGGWFFV